MIYWFLYVLFAIPFMFILPVKVYGKKSIGKKQNYIYVFNHQSTFDAIILNMRLKKHIFFCAKKELWKGKEKDFFFDNILGCIKIDRQKGLNLTTMKKVLSILNDNKSIGIAPEGTRNKKEFSEDTSIKNGACLFSIKSKTPIIPCYIEKKQKAFCKNTLVIGKPFEFKELYDKRFTKEELESAGKTLLEKMNEVKHNFEKMRNEKLLIKKLKHQN